MLKANMLVELFFIQPNWMMCIRATLALAVDLNFSPSNWLGWMKSFAVTWNWILSLMNFLINLPSVFSSMMGLNDLDELYKGLLGLGMIIIKDLLKWLGQYPKSIQAFAIFMMLDRHSLCFRMDLR